MTEKLKFKRLECILFSFRAGVGCELSVSTRDLGGTLVPGTKLLTRWPLDVVKTHLGTGNYISKKETISCQAPN